MSQIKKNPVLYLFLILLPFSFGLFLAHTISSLSTPDSRFLTFADKIFENEVKTNTLTLHYTLADPDSYGIHNYPLTLGSLSAETSVEQTSYTDKLLQKLHTFDLEELSRQNQILYDTLDLVLQTESDSHNFSLLYEPLSPTLGIQAQLPVLFAEYTFRSEQDIKDYLSLLEETVSYFQQILDYEKEKSAAGLFMNSTTADGVIAQCTDFISDRQDHYLITVFEEKIDQCSFLSDKKKEKYRLKNEEAMSQFLFPAYQLLIDGLTLLADTGINDHGLYYLPDGQSYYAYLVESSTGIYDSIDVLEQRLYQQLYSDYMQIMRLLTVYPDIAEDAQPYSESLSTPASPEEILVDLQEQMRYEFPQLPAVEYEVKYVDDALKEHLSPAFYLTPPLDTKSPNSIYLNLNDTMTGITLYSTLAHEGFPGHLYQTQYFSQTDAHPLLSLFSSGGYVEGWAVYIESYAYRYAPVPYEISQYFSLNRSFHLCLYSILDIGIHYHGWKPERVNKLLLAVGIEDTSVQTDIYQCLLEDPANYLKYCAGSIYLQDIRNMVSQKQGNDFDLCEFHKKILEIGPVPFPVLEKYSSL